MYFAANSVYFASVYRYLHERSFGGKTQVKRRVKWRKNRDLLKNDLASWGPVRPGVFTVSLLIYIDGKNPSHSQDFSGLLRARFEASYGWGAKAFFEPENG